MSAHSVETRRAVTLAEAFCSVCKHFKGEATLCAHCASLEIPHPMGWPPELLKWLNAEHWKLKLETTTPELLRIDLLLAACQHRVVGGVLHPWTALAVDVYPYALKQARETYPLAVK